MTFTFSTKEVLVHLQDVHDDPSKSLNERLLESLDGHATGLLRVPSIFSSSKLLPEAIDESDRDALLNQLSRLLPTLQQDPTPVTDLIDRLISSIRYDFTRVLSIDPPVDFVAGLAAPSPPVNTTTLNLLQKAQHRIGDVGIVARKADVVGALVRLWLCSHDTAVARLAHEVISGLLQAEVESRENTISPNGKWMWRRLFGDRDIYGSIFSICSLTTAGQDGQPSKREKTVAQARLLDMILRIDGDAVRQSQIPEIEKQYGVNEGGLLHFAAIHMVDYRNDVLMHVNLLDFYAMYLSGKQKMLPQRSEQITNPSTQPSTFPLDFLRQHRIHQRSLAYFLNPEATDPIDISFLYGRSANYLSTWASIYPNDFLEPEVVAATLGRLLNVLRNVSPGQWAQGRAPKDDLHVLASLPRVVLIPRRQSPSPLFLIPSKPANQDAFLTLAYVFNGSQDSASENSNTENAVARALYYLYVEQHPDFWRQVVTAAETVALKEVALAALSLMTAVIKAHWALLPSTESSSDSPFVLPTENALANKCHAPSLPATGIEAIMTEPAIGVVIPYLIKPAQTFSNLVGGGRGDVESAAYKVAVAKHETLIQLHEKLRDWVGNHPEAQQMLATVARRVAQGPMGGTSEVGGRVGTMEL